MSSVATPRSEGRYSFVQRLLHWIIAVLVICALCAGFLLWSYGFEGLMASFGQNATNAIYKYHKTAGVLILFLMLLRLALRLVLGAPPAPSTLTPNVAAIARATHLAFYVLLILMAVVGWLATSAGGFPVEFFNTEMPALIGKNEALSGVLYRIHGILGLLIGGLVVLHAAAALRHWLILKDGVMQRIGLP